MSVEKPLLGTAASGADDEVKVDAAGLAVPSYACVQPLHVIGVQKESPVAWSPDGTRLCFVSGNKSLCLLSQRTGADDPRRGEYKVDCLLEGHKLDVKALSFCPRDPNIIVSGGYEGIFIWNTAERRVSKRLHSSLQDDAHEGDVLCFEWAMDGTSLLSGGKDSDIKIWDVLNDWKLLETIVGHKSSVLAVAFNKASGLIASAGRDSTIKLWNGASLVPEMRAQRADDSGIKCGLMNNMDGHRGDVVALTWLSNGFTLMSGARDNSVKLWDVRAAVVMRDIEQKSNGNGKHRGDVRTMIVLPGDSYMLSCSLDSTIKVWKLASVATVDRTVELSEAKRDEAEAKLLASILGSGASTTEAAAELESDIIISTIEAFDDEGVHAMALNPRFPVLATSSSLNGVRLWKATDIANPTFLQEFRGHTAIVHECCLLRDTHLVTVSDDYNIHLYNIDNSERPIHLPFDSSVLCAAVRPAGGGKNGYVIAGGADYTLKAFAINAAEYAAVTAGRLTKPEPHEYVSAKFVGHAGRVNTVDIHPNGEMFASGGFDFCIMLWKLADTYPACEAERLEYSIPSFKPLAKIDAHKGHIKCLRFKPPRGGESSTFLATCSNDHSVKVWKVGSGLLGPKLHAHWSALESHASCASAVSWGKGPTADTLFSSSWDRSINVFALNPRIVDKEAQPSVPALRGHAARITDTDVSEDGQLLVSVSTDVTAVVWNATAPYAPLVRYSMSANDGYLSAVSAGRTLFVTASESGQISVWPFPVEEYMGFMKPFATVAAAASSGALTAKGPAGVGPKVTLSLADASAITPVKEEGAGAGAGAGEPETAAVVPDAA